MPTPNREAYAVPTLFQLMDFHGNNWDEENRIFKQITSRELDDTKLLDPGTHWNHLSAWDVGRKISLVVPTQLPERKRHLQLTLKALHHQSFIRLGPRRSILEIVIVNDGPAEPDDVFQVAKFKPERAELRVFCLEHKLGPARARNIGLYYSRGDIIFFLDSDMLLEPHLIAEHIIRHEYIPNLALLSFRDDIELDKAEQTLESADPRIEGSLTLNADWQKDWKARPHKISRSTTINGTSLRVGRKYRIYDITEGLRHWKSYFHGQDTHSDRNLPSAFATSCVSVRREHLIAVGGFRSHYKGWGIEDRDLGSRLLARGVRLVTVRSAGARHIKHVESPPETKEVDKTANIARYNSLIHEPYHERPDNLTRQITQLVKEQIICPALEFLHGTALPRTQKTLTGQSPLVLALETLLRQADYYFRHWVQSMHTTSGATNVAQGDLKWRVMLEESPGGALSVQAAINTTNRPDGSTLRLPSGGGWVGFIVQNAMMRLQGSVAGAPPDIALRPMAVDFTDADSESVAIAHSGLTDADKVRTAYYRFLIAAPIVIHLGWPNQHYYCNGAVTVHSGISMDFMRAFSLEDAPIVSRLKQAASVQKIGEAIQPGVATHEILRGILRDLAHSCGDFLVRWWTDSDRNG